MEFCDGGVGSGPQNGEGLIATGNDLAEAVPLDILPQTLSVQEQPLAGDVETFGVRWSEPPLFKTARSFADRSFNQRVSTSCLRWL